MEKGKEWKGKEEREEGRGGYWNPSYRYLAKEMNGFILLSHFTQNMVPYYPVLWGKLGHLCMHVCMVSYITVLKKCPILPLYPLW